MRRPEVWGGHMELVAAGHLTNSNVVVYQSGGPVTKVLQLHKPVAGAPPPRTLRLSYHGRNHYNSVRRVGVRYGLNQWPAGVGPLRDGAPSSEPALAFVPDLACPMRFLCHRTMFMACQALVVVLLIAYMSALVAMLVLPHSCGGGQWLPCAPLALRAFDASLGVPFPEVDFAAAAGTLSASSFLAMLTSDPFVYIHLVSWFMIGAVTRDAFVCVVVSLVHEVIEHVLCPVLPNYCETWWDTSFDVVMNTTGIWAGCWVATWLLGPMDRRHLFPRPCVQWNGWRPVSIRPSTATAPDVVSAGHPAGHPPPPMSPTACDADFRSGSPPVTPPSASPRVLSAKSPALPTGSPASTLSVFSTASMTSAWSLTSAGSLASMTSAGSMTSAESSGDGSDDDAEYDDSDGEPNATAVSPDVPSMPLTAFVQDPTPAPAEQPSASDGGPPALRRRHTAAAAAATDPTLHMEVRIESTGALLPPPQRSRCGWCSQRTARVWRVCATAATLVAAPVQPCVRPFIRAWPAVKRTAVAFSHTAVYQWVAMAAAWCALLALETVSFNTRFLLKRALWLPTMHWLNVGTSIVSKGFQWSWYCRGNLGLLTAFLALELLVCVQLGAFGRHDVLQAPDGASPGALATKVRPIPGPDAGALRLYVPHPLPSVVGVLFGEALWTACGVLLALNYWKGVPAQHRRSGFQEWVAVGHTL